MSLNATARDLARQANERRVSALGAKLEELKAREIHNSAELVEAFKPIVDMMADLLQSADRSQADTVDLLDRLQTALNRLDYAMGQAPDTMRQAAVSASEGMAVRLEAVADSLSNLGSKSTKAMQGLLQDAQKMQAAASGAMATTSEQAEARIGKTLAKVERAAARQEEAAAAVTKASRTQWILMGAIGIGSALLTSACLLLAVWKMGGLHTP